jgi:isopropylmalate/homocitrate/citramalate synthase
MAEQLLAMPAATHVLREAHRKELAASTGAKRKVSRISVSSLLAGRQIEGEADLDQALQMVKDAARRALQDGNVVELI